MFSHYLPSLPYLLFRQTVNRYEVRSLIVIAYIDLHFTFVLEYVDMWRFVIVWPDDEAEAVDVENGWHE